MIGQWEAMLIAAPWAVQDALPGVTPSLGVSEFDLGFVLWRVPAPDEHSAVGEGTVVVDRRNGELTHWPAIAPERVAELYRERRGQAPVPPLTWDPVAQARHERVRGPFPQNLTQLRLADGHLRVGRSMKGDGTPNLHRLVREGLAEIPAGRRVRGADRCSEVVVLSDFLHAEDAARTATGEPPLSVEDARSGPLRSADLVTYRRLGMEPPEPGRAVVPCRSCRFLLRRLGVTREHAPGGRK